MALRCPLERVAFDGSVERVNPLYNYMILEQIYVI